MRDLPSVLTGETGIWKNITEETMTTTRFTQFPTEWVTGDTICNIIYDTCHQMHLFSSKKFDKNSINLLSKFFFYFII